jgi:hypothetical protein
MKPTFILLSKVGLGGAGGLIGLIIIVIVCFYLWIKDENGDIGCLSLLFFPLLLPYLMVKVIYRGFEKVSSFDPEGKKFDLPPSQLLKILVALSAIGFWILLFALITIYDDSFWSIITCMYIIPILFAFMYILWKKLFFAWLGLLHPKLAIIIAIVSILLIIAFWIVAIKAYNHYTSTEYLHQYWSRKYGLT